MDIVIKEYTEAISTHIKACENETLAKLAKRNSYSRIMKAKEEMRAMEKELLEDKVTL